MEVAGRLVVDGRDCGPVATAATALTRARGMLGRRRPPALLLLDCPSVHGVGMTTALDVALLDADLVVVHVARLRPFGLVPPRRGARHVLEAPAGSFATWGVGPSSRLEVVPVAKAVT